MVHALALGVVLLAGLYLVLLGAAAFAARERATRFLAGFATTARAHWAELAVLAVVGGAFVLASPRLRPAPAFALVGWVLLLTALALALVPWRTHHAFARRAVPHAVRHLRLVGAAALAIGALVLAAALSAAAG